MLGQPALTGAACERQRDRSRPQPRLGGPLATISVWALYWLAAGSIQQVSGGSAGSANWATHSGQLGHHWRRPQRPLYMSQLEAADLIRPARSMEASSAPFAGLAEAAGEYLTPSGCRLVGLLGF